MVDGCSGRRGKRSILSAEAQVRKSALKDSVIMSVVPLSGAVIKRAIIGEGEQLFQKGVVIDGTEREYKSLGITKSGG